MNSLEKRVESLLSQFEEESSKLISLKDLESLKVKYLGKKGALSSLMEELRSLSSEEKRSAGALINQLKEKITHRMEELSSSISQKELEKRLEAEKIDVTLPGRRAFLGRRHVVLKVMDEALDVLIAMGFSVEWGPDIESDYYNFEALNFSKDHPARDMQDTFYINGEYLLRTHTSNTQVRAMEQYGPPLRLVMPGTCYRNEDVSYRSHVIFHQIEGLYIDREVNFSDLLVTLEEFFSTFLGKECKMRFRPSYFPFVEPGVEVDIGCISCGGKGCGLCKMTGWLEVAGAGMVHPEVMRKGNIDPEEFRGYAWGFGIERIAMLRYGITDIRYFYDNNLQFLEQF